MRKSLFLVLLLLFSFSVKAQKFGYIDSEYIMSKMPQYKDLKTNMDKYLDKWTTEIRKEYDGVNELKMKFQQEEILLTDEMKQNRLTEIQGKEDELKILNNKVFGMEGILFQKKKELMKPIMDDIFKACEQVSREKKLMFLFDKAGDISMIYTDPRHDYTDFVLEALGVGETDDKQIK